MDLAELNVAMVVSWEAEVEVEVRSLTVAEGVKQ